MSVQIGSKVRHKATGIVGVAATDESSSVGGRRIRIDYKDAKGDHEYWAPENEIEAIAEVAAPDRTSPPRS
jgi:hypothetical protein